MIIRDEGIKYKLKKILLENIVPISVFIMIFVYFLLEGDVAEVAFIAVCIPWLAFSFSLFSVLFDWKTYQSWRGWLLASFILSLSSSLLFFSIGLEKVVYLFMLYALAIGFVSALVLTIFSAIKSKS